MTITAELLIKNCMILIDFDHSKTVFFAFFYMGNMHTSLLGSGEDTTNVYTKLI